MTYFAPERLLSSSTSSSRPGDLAAEKVDEVHVDKADLAPQRQQQRAWLDKSHQLRIKSMSGDQCNVRS